MTSPYNTAMVLERELKIIARKDTILHESNLTELDKRRALHPYQGHTFPSFETYFIALI